MKQTTLAAYAIPTAEKLAREMGLVLVDAELVRENTGHFLRFFIDKDQEGGITLDDCEAFHRAIHPLMDSIDYDYMEVASPGADRPLKKTEDFERAIGTNVEVRLYRAIDGLKAYTGTLLRHEKDSITIDCGAEMCFDLKQVARVAPVIDVDEDALSDVFDMDE